ncbi:MAG TPA: CBS domain-containing protein [Thermoanaerobaculia bacterium]|nr:CBS domain-containing protein [Thermoanaerobaculia bacterium]
MRPITAADLMNPEVLTVRDDLPVRELARFLVDNDITGAPVEAADGRLVGVVSVVDIANLASEAAPSAETTGDAAADEEDDAEGEDDEDGDDGVEAPSPFFSGGWSEDALAEDDLAQLGLGDDDLLVEDIMTPHVFSVSPETTVSGVASLMLKEHLHRVLVVDGGRPVGIISTSDLLGLLVDEP